MTHSRESESQNDNRTREQSEMGLFDSKGALRASVKMEKVVPVFIQQLKMLLGLSSEEWVRLCMYLYA